MEPLGLIVIDRNGHGGTLTRVSVDTSRLNDNLSSEQLLQAVRSASWRHVH
jgi:hypothetical protein